MDLGSQKISSLLLKFSIPAITGMLVNAMYNIVDRIFISFGVGSTAFSSLTVTGPLSTIMFAFAMLVGLGCSALISIRLGENNTAEAEKILANGLSLLVILSIFLTFLGLIFLEPILIILGASESQLPYAKEYMVIIISGVIFQMVGFGMNHMIRASGKPKLAMSTMLIGAVLNTILDAVFIFVFHWGIKGAAFATIFSQMVSMVWVLSCFVTRKCSLRLHTKYLIPKLSLTLKIFSIGVSSFATQIAASLVGAVANFQLRNYGGDIAFGTMGIITSVNMFFLMPIFGLNQGSQPIIGYNYGAKQYDRVKQTLKYTISIATIICVVAWIFVVIVPQVIIGAFTNDTALVEASIPALRIYLIALPIVGFQIISTVFFQAIGQATKSLVISMLRQVIVLIPAFVFLPMIFGLRGMWYAGPIADILSSLITAFVLFSNLKKL